MFNTFNKSNLKQMSVEIYKLFISLYLFGVSSSARDLRTN